jgi:DNA-directed RNA polymerase subunit beta
MSNLHIGKGNIRKSFGGIKDIVAVPDLIEIQSASFNDFVQLDHLPSERKIIGLEKVLRDIFPIVYNDRISLEYVSYELGNWACACGKVTGLEARYQWTCSSCKKSGASRLDQDLTCESCKKKTARYRTCPNCLTRVSVKPDMTLEECKVSGQTFLMPLRIKVQLVNWDVSEAGERTIRDVKEQDIFFADLPVMADLYEQDGIFKLGNLGTFLINGVDRVVVSQLHRSPGAIFSQSKKTKDFRGRPYYLARIIPMRGSWLDFEFDSGDNLYVRIDKKKKVLVTVFLQALGIARDKIIGEFYDFDVIYSERGEFYRKLDDKAIGQRIEKGMLPESYDKEYLGRRLDKVMVAALKKDGVQKLMQRQAGLLGRFFVEDVIDLETGEILIEQGQALTEDHFDIFSKIKKIEFKLIHTTGYVFQPTIALTLANDDCYSEDDALVELHSKIWPGDNATIKEIKERIESLFFDPRMYDLTKVGRVRINRKFGLSIAEDTITLTREDIIATIRYLVNLRERGEGELDDIDHLGNRRVRLVGELLSNQVYLGFLRIERIVRERFRVQDLHSALMPQDLLNVKPLSAVIREFFGLGQLSQFMDQTNPLAEIAHKRRLSALGPGGVLKDRATYEIRDVHTSHYGRICPIETPEGQTVGLISSLATYAMVNDLGFIETAYRPVVNGKIKDDVVFLDAFAEAENYIAQASAAKGDKIEKGSLFARYQGNFMYVDSDKIDYVDLSPKQLVSVSAALVPFLEHDDATRALMGSNMQRQAVPLIRTESPLVATGMEKEVARASCAVLMARRSGVVEYVSSERIVIRCDKSNFRTTEDWINDGIDTYELKKFKRSSHSTWIHHIPIVKKGDKVNAGDMLTNGPAINHGELALGSNLLVAFMPWHGYNFEDAIVLSERLVADDELTSVHLEEYDVEARDTKLGPEEITRDIPNVSETALAGLDEDGIVKIGTRVIPGDILVGKVTLKGDVQYSPEEKLLRAIFGEKSREVRDTSLRVPPGLEGTVVDVRIFSRSGIRKDKRYKQEVERQAEQVERDFKRHEVFLENMVRADVINELNGQELASKEGLKKASKSKLVTREDLHDYSLVELFELHAKDKSVVKKVGVLKDAFENKVRILAGLKAERIAKLKKGDQLPSGVIKRVRVYIAMKRSVSVGDKVAGRHGNKGVVSNIVHREDMPYLEDGTPVDVVLNPLGVPSRMNVGQILETALGLAGKKLGDRLQTLLETQGYQEVKGFLTQQYGAELLGAYEKEYGKEGVFELGRKTAQNGVCFETPVFDSASYEGDIKPLLQDLNLPEAGSFRLRDGRTGEYFDQNVTIGVMYVMKLNHMVDDKLHARSVGPYSLVTQQPLGGKAQMGGQRLGEMEVWALEAYGAAYTLQEMLTYKSDDVTGRHKVYEAMVRGEDVPEPGLPESFNVLVKELQSLGLQVDLFKSGKEKAGE